MSDEARARERYQLARKVFLQVLEHKHAERQQAIEALCKDDAPLREEVESLLANVDSDTDHLIPRLDTAAAPAELEQQLASLRGELHERFEAGQSLGDRYVLHECIGEGGMGQVWRAQDLMLGETVALKFIRGSTGRARDQVWIDRLLGEVSAARKVTHGNVCRVHDVGTANEEVFISMEFIDGRDLGVRLREVGRLDARASRQLAREVVSALTAIHRADLLHRDLKPANVLLDTEGTAQLTDFGLATSAAEIDAEESQSGTLSYMAPEVLLGRAPSTKSDLYSLGLVLYEAVTNRRAFHSSPEILRRADRGELPPAPSLLVPDVDPVLDRVICRCLAPLPDDRPESAEFLLHVLECRDPLDAVMALGDQPSADIIAASSAQGLLSPRAAKITLAAFFVLLGLLIALVHWTQLGSSLPSASPESAAERAHTMLQQLDSDDWQEASSRFSYGFNQEVPAIDARLANHTGESWRLALPTGDDSSRSFWLRESSSNLCPTRWSTVMFGSGQVTFQDPPASTPGLRSVIFGPDERLLSFHTTTLVPQDVEVTPSTKPTESSGDATLRTCTPAFRLAGFDPQSFRSAQPLLRGDGARQHAAWLATGDERIRVEAELAGSRLLAFHVLLPAKASLEQAEAADDPDDSGVAQFFLIIVLLLIASPLAIRHFRSGRGDYIGAARLAVVCGMVTTASWYLVADYPSDSVGELLLYLLAGLMLGLGAGGCVWLFYMAVEPSVQRDWPRAMVAWGRLLRGRIRDPLVQSHVLLGLCLGLLAPLFLVASRALAGVPIPSVEDELILAGSNWSTWIEAPLYAPTGITVVALEFLAAITFLRFVFRSRRVAVAAAWLLASGVLAMGIHHALDIINVTLVVSLMLWVLLRLGMLAFFGMAMPTTLFDSMPIARSFDDWYAGGSIFAIGLLTVLAVLAGCGLMRRR